MSIVTGRLRGRNIITPKGRNTRPTSDQTRESIFNILGHAEWSPALDGAIVADIFAGSGALGLEAISRGAEFCLFVETEPNARARACENIGDDGPAQCGAPLGVAEDVENRLAGLVGCWARIAALGRDNITPAQTPCDDTH